MKLHQSAQSKAMVITPLYSVDNYNYSQLPTVSYTQEALDTCTFNFTSIEAKYIKFILTKEGPDGRSNLGRYSYEFGLMKSFL